MAYVKRIVCLANSFKLGGTCIAGLEVLAKGYGGWVRPVSSRETGELGLTECLYADNELPRLLDVIDVPLLRSASNAHQIENHIIDPEQAWQKVGVMPFAELRKLEEHPASLWIDRDRTRGGLNNCVSAVDAARFEGSLLLIRARDATVEMVEPKALWMSFGYGGRKYRLKVTDPEVKGAGAVGDAYLCISLTLPYKGDGRCHKLVAGAVSER